MLIKKPNHFFRKTLMVTIVSFCALITHAQWVQRGSDILGTGYLQRLGNSVSISDNGNFIAIANNNVSMTSVRVYKYDGEIQDWISVGGVISGDNISNGQETEIALSSDGSTIVIGRSLNTWEGLNSGSVHVYRFQDQTAEWTQLGQVIIGETDWELVGTSVAVSDNGNIIAIGVPFGDGNGQNAGYAKMYHYDSDQESWLPLGEKIHGDAPQNLLGISVDLSSSGTTVVTGARNDGYVKIFDYNPIASDWVQKGETIYGEHSSDAFGESVSISGDGNFIAVGAHLNDNNGPDAGLVNVYQFQSGAWTPSGSNIVGENAGDRSGRSVSISADGSRVAIGAYWNDGSGDRAGHSRVYEYQNNNWSQLGNDIDGEAAGAYSGFSVSLSSDGSKLIIGAPNYNGNSSFSGYAQVYEFPTFCPETRVQYPISGDLQGSVPIPDGSENPTSINGTNFGQVAVGDVATHTFT
ncbi:MAG: hypothetical protein AAGA66_15745, partial [Bacteroidota bacterium]